jgi:2-hydroxychromene-2-carboxylate isomerase
MHIQPLKPLVSDCAAIVYLDLKSPYAYLAIEPTRALEEELGVQFDWRPFVLDIPSYLGSARLDADGNVAEQTRSDEQWAGVKYAYYDCRRYASMYGLIIRGTVKIWDTNLAATAMLWAQRCGFEVQQQFIDLLFQPFWRRELDAENHGIIEQLLDQAGANGAAFTDWAQSEGLAQNAQFQTDAFAAGLFGVPSYVVGEELYFGREHLPNIGWQLKGRKGQAPDIGNPVPPADDSEEESKEGPQEITIGIDDSMDSLLALPQLIELLSEFSGTVNWVMVKTIKPVIPELDNIQLRTSQHTQRRKQNRAKNEHRYHLATITNIPDAIGELLHSAQISLQSDGPSQVVHPAMSGIAILWNDEILIGRQHLPLIKARLEKS